MLQVNFYACETWCARCFLRPKPPKLFHRPSRSIWSRFLWIIATATGGPPPCLLETWCAGCSWGTSVAFLIVYYSGTRVFIDRSWSSAPRKLWTNSVETLTREAPAISGGFLPLPRYGPTDSVETFPRVFRGVFRCRYSEVNCSGKADPRAPPRRLSLFLSSLQKKEREKASRIGLKG